MLTLVQMSPTRIQQEAEFLLPMVEPRLPSHLWLAWSLLDLSSRRVSTRPCEEDSTLNQTALASLNRNLPMRWHTKQNDLLSSHHWSTDTHIAVELAQLPRYQKDSWRQLKLKCEIKWIWNVPVHFHTGASISSKLDLITTQKCWSQLLEYGQSKNETKVIT